MSAAAAASVWLVAALLVAAPGTAAADPRPYRITEERTPCEDFEPQRRVWFGDIHAHTSFSQDADVRGTRNHPSDAYRFARGERLGIQPYAEDGSPFATVALDRPLDFAAVTDHAELLGESHICRTPDLPGYDSWTCRVYRGAPDLAYLLMNAHGSRANPIRFAFCGALGVLCLEASAKPWAEIQRAAEAAYDRSERCAFTSFVGYEWSGSRLSKNLHRNVIFRNRLTLELPVGYYEEPRPEGLWEALSTRCNDAPGDCEAIVIPHNSNLSSGLMFLPESLDYGEFTAVEAAQRARFERLVEVMQHKGDSECRPGVNTSDELCGFEKLSFGSLGGKYVPFMGDPNAPTSFVRNALGVGLEQQVSLGVNPFKLGLVAGTDSHVGTPGAVAEDRHVTHAARGDVVREAPPSGLQDHIEFNPGGLMGIWAEENARDSLFEAMLRREVFGTSGPRISLRFFAGWSLPDDVCESGEFARHGYAAGVPMGGDLSPPAGTAATSAPGAPVFGVEALRDPGSALRAGTPLERIQIVKGCVEDGSAREAVFDVAGSPPGRAGADPRSCERHGAGHARLCGVWRDPDFDPAQPAFYYVRVLENPSCRWNAFACNRLEVDCSDRGSADRKLFASCCDAGLPRTIQERAWSSPIWYTPGAVQR